MMTNLRYPQPLGAFGFLAGLLLVPDSAEGEAARAELVQGRLPAVWPDALRGHEFVHADDLEAAIAAFSGGDPIVRYNRWVLQPEGDDAAEVKAGLPSQVAPLVDVVACTTGQRDSVAVAQEDLPGEVMALVHASLASHAYSTGDVSTAADLLEQAAKVAHDSPALAAIMRGNAGAFWGEVGDYERAQESLISAADGLKGTSLGEVRAELLQQVGRMAQEVAATSADEATRRGLLHEAMGHYYEALQCVSEESAPYLWGSLNMDLAAAHLAVPMTQATDQLRLGVATQALRACRRVFTQETAPAMWASATLNLANALIYTPSTHQGDNLVEAVELYEEVLGSGVRDADPMGRARLLTNQGNALAHLGIFDQAKAKLAEARYIFEEHLDHDSVMTVREILGEIAKSEVHDPELADLARQAEQMSRVELGEGAFTSGMGVQVRTAGDLSGPPPTPKVTVLKSGQTHPSMEPDQ